MVRKGAMSVVVLMVVNPIAILLLFQNCSVTPYGIRQQQVAQPNYRQIIFRGIASVDAPSTYWHPPTQEASADSKACLGNSACAR